MFPPIRAFRGRTTGGRTAHSARMLAAATAALLALAACGTATSTPGSASKFDVHLTLADHNGSRSGLVDVAVEFHNADGISTEFNGGEKVQCDGVFLTWNTYSFNRGGGYTGVVPIQPVGGQYVIDYWDEHGHRSSIAVLAAAAPTITHPVAGDTVRIPRNGSLAIAYTSGQGARGIPVVVSGYAADNRGDWVAGSDQSETGSYTLTPGAAGSPFTRFVPGFGSVQLTREFKGTLSAGDFSAVSLDYFVGATVAVTWQ